MEVDEPITTEAYIVSFRELAVRAVFIDDLLLKNADGVLKAAELSQEVESKMLREVKDMMYKVNMADTFEFISKIGYECLFRIYAKKALEELDFGNAEKAFLKCDDYKSLQTLKRVQNLDDKEKQKAEILVFYGKYDDAEECYRKMDRRDLAIQMRMRVGDWTKVLQMAKDGGSAVGEEVLQTAYNELGNFHAQRMQFDQAAQYYLQAKNYDGLIDAYTRLEDYESLEKIMPEIPEGTSQLLALGDKFQSVGMCEAAVKCFERCNEIKRAIDCCVLLNHWNIAVELAEQHNFMQIEGLLTQQANQLLEKNQKLEAAELYRKANHNTEAAKLLSQIADDLIEREVALLKLYYSCF